MVKGDISLVGIVEEWVENYPSVGKMAKRLIRRRGGSPNTLQSYCYGIKYFLEFLSERDGSSLDPETAIQAFKNGETNALEAIDDFIESYLDDHTNKAVRGLVYGVKKWLEVNHVQVNWKDLDMPSSTRIREIDRAPSKEELRHIVNYGNLHVRDRATILIAASSGLRVGTLISLKLGDVDFNYSNPDIARITVRGGDGRKLPMDREYYTFMTPEAKKSLLEYLDWRRRSDEDVTDDSPLIGSLRNEGPILSRASYSRHWRRILKRVGKTEKANKWLVIHLHTLRKFFRTQCEVAGVPRGFWDFWMGHTGGYLDNSYFRANGEQHVEEYAKAIPYLSVLEPRAEIEKQTQRIADLETMNKQLRERLEELEKKNLGLKQRLNGFTLSSDQVQDLLKRIEKLEKQAKG